MLNYTKEVEDLSIEKFIIALHPKRCPTGGLKTEHLKT